MGSISRRAETPPYARQPTSARSNMAADVVDGLLEHVRSFVFQPDRLLGRERECYEVASDLREQGHAFGRIVRDKLPGSATIRKGVAQNRMTLDCKITMVVTDKLVNEVVRPGPNPEDRQASDLTSEMLALRGDLVTLVSEVIAVDDRARGLTS
jgi:hypothetical protein